MSSGPARDRLLDAAEALVLRHGFAATTVDAVLAVAGASKGGFFHHFPTKAHLGRALVERYAAGDGELLDAVMTRAEAQTDDPAEQLVAFTRAFEEQATGTPPRCLFVSFIYETDLSDVGTESIVRDSIVHWRARIVEKLERAVEAHPPATAVDLPSLADMWFTTFEGAFLLGQALSDDRAVGRQLAHLRHYLELLFDLAPAGPQ